MRLPVRMLARRGKIMAIMAISLPVLFGMAAFAIDVGIVFLARVELQRATDSAALAGTLELEPTPLPLFPLESPVAIGVGVPEVLAAELGYDLATNAQVGGQKLEVIKPQVNDQHGPYDQIAKDYFSRNPISYVDDVQLADDDIRAFHVNSALPAPGLLALTPALSGISDLAENLLLSPPHVDVPNAVGVTVTCGKDQNQHVPLFLAPILGTQYAKVSAHSDAALLKGYGVRPGVKMLPFAMDITVWRVLRIGNGTVNGIPITQQLLGQGGRPVILVDEQNWDRETQTVSRGSDRIWEVLLLDRPLHEVKLNGIQQSLNILGGHLGLLGPLDLLSGLDSKVLNTPATIVSLNYSGRGKPGVGTVNRQLVNGLTAQDMGSERLSLPFTVYGDEGIPPESLDTLESIVGKPRILPLFDTLPGTAINKVKGVLGKRESYRIVGFAGVVVTEVGDLGVVKYVKFQPATVISQYVVKANSEQATAFSDCVYTCPVLIE